MIRKSFLNLIIARLDGDRIEDSSYRDYIIKLVEEGIAGFIIFGGEYEKVKDFLSHIQSISSKTLIIASDIERGVGQQIKGGTIIPCQMAIRAGFKLPQDCDELEKLYSIVIKEARDVGINLALIPVLDVNTEPKNPIICTRSFSDNPKVVSEYGSFIINFFQSQGLPTCGKHFPGHGGVSVDSHLDLPYLTDRLNLHLKPFRQAVKAEVSAIMVGHISIPVEDNYPASLSEWAIKELLRKKIRFKGLVLTDAMNMKALSAYNNPHALALKAGADIILHPENPYKASNEIGEAYERGLINEERIKEAKEKIDKFRIKLTLEDKDSIEESSEEIPFIVKQAFKRSVTVIRNRIEDLQNRKIIPYLVGNYTQSIFEIFRYTFDSAYDLMEYKKTGKIPLIAAFTDIRAAGQSYSLKEEEKAIIYKIIKENKNSIFVSFGNPYVTNFELSKRIDTIVLLYDSNEMAVYAFLDYLSEGLSRATGVLPVRIRSQSIYKH